MMLNSVGFNLGTIIQEASERGHDSNQFSATFGEGVSTLITHGPAEAQARLIEDILDSKGIVRSVSSRVACRTEALARVALGAQIVTTIFVPDEDNFYKYVKPIWPEFKDELEGYLPSPTKVMCVFRDYVSAQCVRAETRDVAAVRKHRQKLRLMCGLPLNSDGWEVVTDRLCDLLWYLAEQPRSVALHCLRIAHCMS